MSCRCRFQLNCKQLQEQQQRFRSLNGICANRTITKVAFRRLLFTHSQLEQAFRTGYLWNKLPHSSEKHFKVFTTGADADIMGFVGDGKNVWRAGRVTGKTCGGRDVWRAGRVTGRTCDGQDVWRAGRVTGRTCDGRRTSCRVPGSL